MKKRRVLALLLALSLAVSTNGMTVLATEGDMPAVSVSIEETAGEAIGSEIPADDQQTDGSVEGSETDGQEQGELPGGEDNAGNPDGDGDSQDQNDGDAVEIPDADENGDLLNGEEESAEPEDKVDSEEQEEVEEEADGELSDDEVPEIRMMSFTDDTGFKITYNAIAVEEYQLSISDGVLNGIKTGDGEAVSGVVVIPEDKGITAIGSAFAGNENITYVKLPAGVTSIKDGAFKNCTKLQGVYLPAKMETIGASAFEQCRSLVKIAVPKSVTTIGNKAFYQDDKLFMVYMKDADYSELTSIGDEAFYECKALVQFCSDTAFVIPGKLKTIGAKAFYKCQSITDVDFNESVEEMGEGAFEDCSSLKSVTLSSLLQDIPKAAFKGCNNLVRVVFKAGNKTIGESAYEGCVKLGGIELAYSIAKIDKRAFYGCTRLVSVEIPNGGVEFVGDEVFPNVSTLTLIGINDSNVEVYAKKNGIKFAGYKNYQSKYYIYTTLPTGTGSGKLTVKDKDGKDPNTLHNKEGVAYNTKLYVYYTPAAGSALVTGSVKCNGVPLNKDSNGVYYFMMPIGGALITAEFVTTSNNKQTEGTDGYITVEMSNGDIVTEQGEVKEVALKVGQYSRMFLIDEKDDNKAIDSSKITFSTDNKAIATVSNTGIIQAVKEGSTKIRATVMGSDGKTITKEVRVSVTTSDVAELKVKATSYDASLIELITSASDDVQTATIDKKDVEKAITFKIKATAYDAAEDDMAVALKWSTSDAKVAKISSTSTTAASPINTVTVPANTDGEATITVTATNADKTTVVQKFIVSVKDYTPRLVSNSLTINPNLEDGAILEIVSAYAAEIDSDSLKLMYSDNSTESRDFSWIPLEDQSDRTVSRFMIKALESTNKTYTVNVSVYNGRTYSIPLKITVKSTQPSPKVAFEKNQPKLDLFKKKDETPVNVVVSNLGNDLVSEYSLEPLSDSDDDKLFTENFKVEYVDGSHCKITQKITEENDSMQFTSKNKAAVTGYLVLKYEGYKDTITKKFKITIPTQTVTPSFKLDRTADTYYVDCDAQEITLQLLDKKNKNLPVDLSKDGYHVQVTTGSGFTRAVTKCEITDDGNIKMPMTKNPDAGKVYLEVTNDSWAEGKKFSYVYTIKTTSSTPTISLKSSTVTMNSRYKEQEAVFELKSNLKDTDIAEDQTFEMPAKLNAKTQAEYEKLSVDYSDGIGTVSIDDPTIANGTYSFVCNNAEYNYKNGRRKANKVTLKVKVTNGVPTVTAKGTLAFNTRAVDDQEKNVEESELTFTTKNLPENYVFDKEATLGSIACTTKNCSEYAEYFDWNLEDGKLKVSMKEWCPAATYKFTVTPTFAYNGPEAADSPNSVSAKALSFNVKVYSGSISVTLASKGKLNLLDRKGECTTNNSIVYTPTFKNLKDTVDQAEIYDVTNGVPSREDDPSKFFDVTVSSDGKLYVTPKPGAQLDNNKTYKVMIWLQPKNYTYGPDEGGLWYNKVLSIKTAQILPKAATDKSTVNLYLSNKSYEATFIVNKKDAKAIGSIESIAFGEKDTKAQESFVTMYDPVTEKNILIKSEPQKDGSLKVTLKLRDTVSYACNSTNKLTMYVKFEGQGSNTAGTAITMNVKINK